jgi:hypothetical protein
MIPLLAAASAIDTVSKIASSAADAWKSLSSKSASKSGADSFASMLSAHGVDVGTGASQSKPSVPGADASSHHHVNRLA